MTRSITLALAPYATGDSFSPITIAVVAAIAVAIMVITAIIGKRKK